MKNELWPWMMVEIKNRRMSGFIEWVDDVNADVNGAMGYTGGDMMRRGGKGEHDDTKHIVSVSNDHPCRHTHRRPKQQLCPR